MREILIFLLIPLVITDDAANILIAKSTIDAGLGAIRQFVPGGQVIAGFLAPFFDAVLKVDKPDPSKEIMKKLDDIEREIKNRLNLIENELIYLGKDIFERINGTIYINSFGTDLNNLETQIELLVLILTINSNSTKRTHNEIIVENAFTIGNNKDWMQPGHMIFNLKNLADTLAGNTFSTAEPRDLYQIVYDNFVPDSLFSGEAYDDSDYYIEKVMNIYLYGCSAIFQSLENAYLLCNFTDNDIESLSPLIKEHYYSTVVSEPRLVTELMRSIAEKVFDIKNESSVISHYLAFKYKKKNCRNIFINLGRTDPVPIANQIDFKEFQYQDIVALYYVDYCCEFCVSKCKLGYDDYLIDLQRIDNERVRICIEANQFLVSNQTGVGYRQMYDLYEHFLKKYKNNTRFEFLSFLLDKGINVSELFDEGNELNFFVHNYIDNVDNGYYSKDYSDPPFTSDSFFCLLHSEGIKDLTHDKSIMEFSMIRMYAKWSGDKYPYIIWEGRAQQKRKVFRLLRGGTTIVPSTAEEIINSTNITIIYDNSTSNVSNDNYVSYVDLENPQIITLGFSNYNKKISNESENIFVYDIHFISLNKNIESLTIVHPINIKYKTKLRNLNSEEMISTCFMNITKSRKFKASCFVPNNDSEIDNLEVIPDFTFISDDNIKIKMSSLANKQKNNIINLENIDYSSYNIYILEKSSIIKNENLLFSINGIINEKINIRNNTDLILSLNNNTNETCEVKCKIINIIDNNYTLNCESNENIYSNLDSSISIINNNTILLLTFNDSESNIEIEKFKPRNYFRKSNKTLGAGAIALIVIIPIIAIISVIAIICFTKKDNKNNTNENGTTNSVDVLNK